MSLSVEGENMSLCRGEQICHSPKRGANMSLYNYRGEQIIMSLSEEGSKYIVTLWRMGH